MKSCALAASPRLSVDAFQCQMLSGNVEIVYSMEKDIAPDYEAREELT